MKSAVVVQVEGALSICIYIYKAHVLARFIYLLSESRCLGPEGP